MARHDMALTVPYVIEAHCPFCNDTIVERGEERQAACHAYSVTFLKHLKTAHRM